MNATKIWILVDSDAPCWTAGLPYWGDDGKRIDICHPDGTIETGVLVEYDMTPGPNELPLFRLVKDDGSHADLYGCSAWRYSK